MLSTIIVIYCILFVVVTLLPETAHHHSYTNFDFERGNSKQWYCAESTLANMIFFPAPLLAFILPWMISCNNLCFLFLAFCDQNILAFCILWFLGLYSLVLILLLWLHSILINWLMTTTKCNVSYNGKHSLETICYVHLCLAHSLLFIASLNPKLKNLWPNCKSLHMLFLDLESPQHLVSQKAINKDLHDCWEYKAKEEHTKSIVYNHCCFFKSLSSPTTSFTI